MRRLITSICLAALFLQTFAFRGAAQVRPIYDSGATGLAHKLKQLQTTASAMHTGAHPDDEDSGLLALLARGENARVTYLSLNRGEGGQNVIGAELFESLGVIRTEELLQARRLDGGEQLFTRAMDYGFSKKREEAARIWNEKTILGDMVRAIRLFRPLVVVSRFTGTPADGHGHHQLAGYLTPLAYRAAADPSQFPEQLQAGLRAWQPKKLYVSQSFFQNAQNPTTLTMNTGEYSDLIGRSYFEIAMEGRSQHKSQEMGLLELRGRQTSGVRLLDSNAGATANQEKSLFDGIDVSIAGIARVAGVTDDFLNDDLRDIQQDAARALADFDAFNLSKSIEPLAAGLRETRSARRKIAERRQRETVNSVAANQLADADFLLAEKENQFADALQTAAGVVVDALANQETVVAGDSLNVAVRVFAANPANARIGNANLQAPANWTAAPAAQPTPAPVQTFRPRDETATAAFFFAVKVPDNQPPTQPYWLEKPRRNHEFDWSAPDAAQNLPFQPPLITAAVAIEIGGETITATKPVQYRYADQIRGELRREINVVPALTAAFDSNLLIVPVATRAQKQAVTMTITNLAPRAQKGVAKLDLPAGWTATPSAADFELKTRNDKTSIVFNVSIPANARPDSYPIKANVAANNQVFDLTMQEIQYPHIQTHRCYASAEVAAKVVNLKVAPVTVGYIMGTGDAVPEAIRRIGLNVTMLSEKDLSSGDLTKFDVIVVGIRASQIRPDFVANNQRLLDYMKNGGTLIVQYQQQEYIQQNLAPFPAKMESVTNGAQRISNVRVTDENAPVKILDPAHPVFNFPNKITAKDFENWVQERNLYNFSTFDAQYKPLLEAHDETEPESSGGMVYARVGKGNYIYNSYSFFRQLPVGNVGAYRIFANLLSLPKATSGKRL